MDREVSRQAEQPGGTVMRITAYSDRGLPSRQSVPSWCCGPPDSWITRTYDLLGRPVRTERPASSEDPSPVATQLSYAGLSVSQTDALGRVTVSRRDVRGNILQAVDAGNADTDYEYDAFGDLVRVRDFRGNETVMTYDLRGRRSSINDVDAGLRTFQYTPFGELKAETNAQRTDGDVHLRPDLASGDSPGTRRHHDVDVGALARCPQRRRPAERVEPGLPGDVCLRHALAVRRRIPSPPLEAVSSRASATRRRRAASIRSRTHPNRAPHRCVCGTTMNAAAWFAFPMSMTRPPLSGRPTPWTRLAKWRRKRSATAFAWTATGTSLRSACGHARRARVAATPSRIFASPGTWPATCPRGRRATSECTRCSATTVTTGWTS